MAALVPHHQLSLSLISLLVVLVLAPPSPPLEQTPQLYRYIYNVQCHVNSDFKTLFHYLGSKVKGWYIHAVPAFHLGFSSRGGGGGGKHNN